MHISLLSLVALPVLVSAATFRSSAVHDIPASKAKSLLKETNKASYVTFYAPWCGHCKNLGPQYDKAADNLKGLANFLAVDCDADANKGWCSDQGVQGFPTVKLFPGGKATPETYQGERKAKPLVDFLTSRMPTFVRRSNSVSDLKSLREKAKSKSKPQSLLFTSSKTTTPLYKALSSDFRLTIDFHAARDSTVGEEGMKEFGITKLPALILVKTDGESIVYDGPLKYEEIKKWYQPFATKAPNGRKSKAGTGGKDEL